MLEMLKEFDEVILATGIKPRTPNIKGIDHPKVLSYIDVLKHKKEVGKKVAIIGAGGIGFDVAEYITHEGQATSQNLAAFLKEWGIDDTNEARGGIEGITPEVNPSPREVVLMQRKDSKIGAGLGKTTGWIHRISLKNKSVKMINGVQYDKIDDNGLHITRKGNSEVMDVDTIILCAGQLCNTDLLEGLENAGVKTHLIGGAERAGELDAKRAIEQGSKLGAIL